MADNSLLEEYYYELAKRSVPKILSEDKNYQVLLELLGSALYRDHNLINNLDYAYNADLADGELLTRIADTLGIDYPISFDENRLRLLLKYYNKIRRNRGSLDSIMQLIRILEATEEDIALNKTEMFDQLEVEEIREGSIIIKYDGITNFEFVHQMLKRVRPAGYEVLLSHIKGPSKYKFDISNGKEKQTIKSWMSKSDKATAQDSANVVKGLRTDRAYAYDSSTLTRS